MDQQQQFDNTEVTNFIATRRAQGVNDMQIQAELEQAGYTEMQYRAAFTRATVEHGNGFSDKREFRSQLWVIITFVLIIGAAAGLVFSVSQQASEPEVVVETTTKETDSGAQGQVSPEAAERDRQRQGDVSLAWSTIVNYLAFNSRLPGDNIAGWSEVISSILQASGNEPGVFTDPTTQEVYTYTFADPGIGEMQYVINARCNDNATLEENAGVGFFVVRTRLENNTYYCIGNQ